MDKQEKAFAIWANSLLQPDEDRVVQESDLASKMLSAQVRGVLWRLYSEDEGVISVMLRLEQRINDGLLRTKSEVTLLFPPYAVTAMCAQRIQLLCRHQACSSSGQSLLCAWCECKTLQAAKQAAKKESEELTSYQYECKLHDLLQQLSLA